MNIFEHNKQGKSYRSASACGYCRTVGHNINECPQVPKDYSYWKDHRVPLQAGNPCRWYSANQPKYWGEWYTKCINAMAKQLDYVEKQNQPKQKRASKPKFCGFCGHSGHNRRNCDKMQTFLANAYRANENWRRKAHHILVSQLGISVGAAIKVEKSSGWGSNQTTTEHVGLVSSVNWDRLNLTCANSTWEDNWKQNLRIEVVIDGNRHPLKFSGGTVTKILQPTFQNTSSYSSITYKDKVAAAPNPLDESWVTDYKEAFDFIAKKRSYERLEEYGITALVEKWK